MKLFIGLLLLIFMNKTWAFPDTLRHGYVSCTSCHVSPAGGGLITSYGRSLSRELMSSWGYKGEEEPLHGMLNLGPPKQVERFLVGGDARYLSYRQENSQMKSDEGFWMQAQLRAALLFEKVKLIMSLGSIENPRVSDEVRMVAPEYYALWTPKEEFYVRGGRFEPNYGLRLPDHNLWIKTELGLMPWNQKDSFEFFQEGESQFFSLAGFQSLTDGRASQQKTGYTGSFYQMIGERNRVGLSAMNAEGQAQRLRALSVHGTLSFNERSYLMLEGSRVSNNGQTKDVYFGRGGYEVFKGFTPFLQTQGRFNRQDHSADQQKYGFGLQWLPRPHFELFFVAEKLIGRDSEASENLFIFHYYL